MFTTGTYANYGIFKVSTQVTTVLLIREFPQPWPWWTRISLGQGGARYA